MMTIIKILTQDRYILSATHFIPKKSVNGVVIINSATGVRQQYYSDFAEYLATQGVHVYTYDYRGIGGSKYGTLKSMRGSLTSWGEYDLTAVIKYVSQRHPGHKLSVIGHSIGGQLIGLSPLSGQISNIVMIASQTPYWKNYRGIMMFKVWLLWHFLIPVFTEMFGYFPAKKAGLFEDLPAGVATQWASWGKNKNYLFDEFPGKKEMFLSLTQNALVLSFSDDRYAPYRAVKDLLQYYKGMTIEHKHISPDQLGRKSIGHFNFFRKGFKHPLWVEVSEWLLKQQEQPDADNSRRIKDRQTA